MKYCTKTVTETIPHTIDGITQQVTVTREVPVPVLPRDWDVIAVRAVHALVVGLTLVSVVWSTVSIANLLGGRWAAYLAAGLFDLSWMTALGLAYIVRHRPDRRALPDRLGWFLLAVTVGALLAEGLRSGSIATALVGAAVSVVAKSLWWCLGKSTAPELSQADAQWVSQVTSEAHARMAVASVRRRAARIEDRAAAELLALESSRRMPDTQHADAVSQSEVPAQVTAYDTDDSTDAGPDDTEDYDPPLSSLSKSAAIRAVSDRHPLATGPEVVAILARHGVEITTKDVATVRYRDRRRTPGADVVPIRTAARK